MTAKERTAHAGTQALGLSLIAAAILVVAVITLVIFGGEDFGLFGLVALVSAAIAWVAWRFDGVWPRVVGLVGTLASGFVVFFLAFGIFQPFSPLEFIVGLTFTLGFFISLIAGVMALVAAIRKRPANPAEGQRFRMAVFGLLGVAAVISITGFFLTRSTVDDAEAANAVVVEMVDFEFEPGSTVVDADQGLVVANSDLFAHDFTLEQFDINVHVGPASEAIVDLSSVTPGTYTYFCSLHSDGEEGMIGTVTVE